MVGTVSIGEGEKVLLAHALKEKRIRNHLSQEEVGNMLGCSSTWVGNVETGNYKGLSVTLHARLSKWLGKGMPR